MRSVAKEHRESRIKRHRRIRKNLSGSANRPRLCVFRSRMHIYAQIIDDVQGVTLVGASTLSPELRDTLKGKVKTQASKELGKLITARATEKGIKQVAFDRGGYRYHGRVKALADSAREAGLEF
ncbi:MAG: 50S ribosomal protein L18 [Candidatus Eisenbacteria sp.]|nr:50S ribosomal protein L18 [Candidatus Eisenbacteria bacterium]